MEKLTAGAIEAVKVYKKNTIIMDFVKKEALEKVASEIRAECKGGVTAKAVELLMIKHKNIAARVEEYINIGLIGCYMAAVENK